VNRNSGAVLERAATGREARSVHRPPVPSKSRGFFIRLERNQGGAHVPERSSRVVTANNADRSVAALRRRDRPDDGAVGREPSPNRPTASTLGRYASARGRREGG
jgi:hypothetical protein